MICKTIKTENHFHISISNGQGKASEIADWSKEIGLTIKQLDEKTMRWLEISDLYGIQ